MVLSVFLKTGKQILSIGFPEVGCLCCCEEMLSGGAQTSCLALPGSFGSICVLDYLYSVC